MTVIIGIMMLATAGILLAGVVGMMRGSDPQKSNRLMQYRILLQALTIFLFILFMSMLRS